MVEAVTRWASVDRLLVDVEGHGRDPVGGVSIDRTVGWFTTINPVLVARGSTFDATVVATGAALTPSRQAPQAFGVLRHLGSPASRSRLEPWAAAPVLFNFLGAPFGADASGPIALATEGTGVAEGAARRSRYLLVVGAARVGERLELELSSGRLDEPELGRLADAALALLAVEQAPSRPTPSDFPLAGLSADELAALLGGAS